MKRLLLILALLAGLSRACAADVVVFAAASLSDALRAVASAYEAASGDHVRLNLAASSALARQIKEGAPSDVFLSADEAKVDELDRAGLLAPGTRVNLLSNSLVIVVNRDGGPAIGRPGDLAQVTVRRLALAETQTVPAGIYARAYLEKIGLWAQLGGKVVATENVRAALAAVEAGNADAGIVYKTDALISKRVKVAYEVPAGDAPAIVYPVAVLAGSRQPESARRFAQYLQSAEARAIFSGYGFLPSP